MIFMFDRLLQLAEAERPDCRLLILGIPYRAPNIFYTQYCHCFSLLLAASTTVARAAATIASAVTTTPAIASAVSPATAASTPTPRSTAPPPTFRLRSFPAHPRP